MKFVACFVVVVAVLAVSACEIAQPFEGPGFDLQKGVTTKAAGPFIASTTLLALKDGDVNQKAFDGHMTILQDKLKTQPGLVGVSLAFSIGSNKNYRTLAVWESEDAMLAWVTGEDHAAAMRDMADKAESGEVASWTIEKSALPPSWDDAKSHLEKDGQKAY